MTTNEQPAAQLLLIETADGAYYAVPGDVLAQPSPPPDLARYRVPAERVDEARAALDHALAADETQGHRTGSDASLPGQLVMMATWGAGLPGPSPTYVNWFETQVEQRPVRAAPLAGPATWF